MLRFSMYASIALLLVLNTMTACFIPKPGNRGGIRGDFAYTNQLIEAKSPYLIRSAHDPVDWYFWGKEALLKAKEEEKLLLFNIGRNSDHLSQDMERNVYSDTSLAGFINAYFVPVKVDLDERPDIYQYFYRACQLLNKGTCDLPMHIVCLPDGSPIFAGAYYDHEGFIEMINDVLGWYDTHTQNVNALGHSLSQDLRIMNIVEPYRGEDQLSYKDLQDITENLQVPREALPSNNLPMSYPLNTTMITYQLRYAVSKNNWAEIEQLANQMKMYTWGVNYDHIGGGFFETPKVPRPYEVLFDKTLKHNSIHIKLYAELFQLTKDPHFEQIVYESIKFVERELTSMERGFYTSVSAESESVNGKYYTWNLEELEDLFRKDLELITDYYNIDASGNWKPGENVLIRSYPNKYFAEKYKMSIISLNTKINSARELCLRAKKSRARPNIDQRRITAWNAQMISAYLQAYQAIGEKEWLETALKHANFLWNNCRSSSGSLFRVYYDGDARGEASLEDYASLANAFFHLYQMTFDEVWLDRTSKIIDYLTVHFGDNRNGMFFLMPYAYEGELHAQIPIRDHDGFAMNAEMSKLLMEVGVLLDRLDYRERSKQMLQNIRYDLIDHPNYYTGWSLALMQAVYPTIEVAIVGEDCRKVMKTIAREYLPQVLFLGTNSSDTNIRLLQDKAQTGKTLVYVCLDNHYPKPTEDTEEAIKFIHRAQGF